MASAFYRLQPAHIVAITGTDGKTSTADFFRQRQGQRRLAAGGGACNKDRVKTHDGTMFILNVIGKGAEEPYRARFRTGSFTAMAIIEAKSPGLFLADLVALIASLDVVAPEIDR